MTLDAVDRQIILATQAGLPLVPQPYRFVARQVGISAEEVMRRMDVMRESGVIRRIGAVPNHYQLGYKFNGMTVWDVADDKIDELGAQVGRLDFVSHCYHRPRHLPDWPYNFFAMVHSKTKQGVQEKAAVIEQVLGEYCRGRAVLYSSRILKKTGLRIGG